MSQPERSEDRLPDAAAVERLADDLLPALIAHFNASGLGELEVRRGGWRVRLRAASGVRPAATPEAADPAPASARKGSRQAVAGLGPAAAPTPASGNGQVPAPDAAAAGRRVARSPGVGYFSPRDGVAAGSAVRAGDVLGHVDVLGVQVEVVSPDAGFVGRVLADAGQAVEYGQDLVRLEPSQPAAPAREG